MGVQFGSAALSKKSYFRRVFTIQTGGKHNTLVAKAFIVLLQRNTAKEDRVYTPAHYFVLWDAVIEILYQNKTRVRVKKKHC